MIPDRELAAIYGVETRMLNQAVKRNSERFPEDFVFQLTAEEVELSRSQSVILNPGRGQNIKYLPYAFTEHGAIQAANILSSPRACSLRSLLEITYLGSRCLFRSTSKSWLVAPSLRRSSCVSLPRPSLKWTGKSMPKLRARGSQTRGSVADIHRGRAGSVSDSSSPSLAGQDPPVTVLKRERSSNPVFSGVI